MSFLPVDGMSLRTIFFVVFVAALGFFLYRDRNKMQRHTIIFFRRTQKGIDYIDRVAKRFPRFWKFYANSGVVVASLSIIASLGMIVFVVYHMLSTGSTEGGPSLILPGLVEENQFEAGVSFIPVEFWVIGIGILMVFHELSHGVVARLEDFEINSVGWGVMAIIPFAFVEPKGEQMLPGQEAEGDSSGHWEQGSWISQIRVLCAGSYANYIIGALLLLAGIALSGAVTQSSGLFYIVEDGYPAAEAGMNNGTLEYVGGERVETLEDLQAATADLQPGDSINLSTSEGNFTVTAVEREDFEGGYLGLRLGEESVIKDRYSDYQSEFEWFASMLWTVAILNIFVGLFNMLPAKPLDGGWTLNVAVEHYLGEKYTRAVDGLSLALWGTVLITLGLSLIGM